MNFNFKKNWYYLIPVAIGGYLIYRQFSKKNDPNADAPKPPVVPDIHNNQVNVPSSDFPLQKGSRNNTVGALQTLLNSELSSQGKTLLVVDNNFGPKTEAALSSIYGKSSIANQIDFDTLKNQLQQTNLLSSELDWGWKLQDAYDKGMYSTLKVKLPITMRKVAKNFQGFWVNDGNNEIQLPAHNYSLNDYAIRAVTKNGNLRIEITNGNLAGMYLTQDGINLKQTFDII